jgi:hypothetical protein
MTENAGYETVSLLRYSLLLPEVAIFNAAHWGAAS